MLDEQFRLLAGTCDAEQCDKCTLALPRVLPCTLAHQRWIAFDVKQANQLVGRFLTAGFYYKTFIKPQRLWPAYQAVLSRFSAGGVADVNSVHGYYDKRYVHADVVVAGAGPSGLAAAIAAADEGARVLLVEEEYELGGHLRFSGEPGLSTLSDLRAQVAARPSIEVMTNSIVTGRYDDNWVAVLQR